jgi:hypothetical protein
MRSNSNTAGIKAVENKGDITIFGANSPIVNTALQHNREMGKKLSGGLKIAARYLTFGMRLRQWLAMWLICAVLLPVLAAPATATVWSADASIVGDLQAEPVNPSEPIWKQAQTKINLKLEKWFGAIEKPVFYNSNGEVIEISENVGDENNPAEIETVNTENGKANENPVAENSEISKKSNENNESKIVSSESNTNTKNPVSQEPQNNSKTKNTLTTTPNATTSAPMALVNQLPDNERESIYSSQNNLGSPFGQTEMDSRNEAAALRIKHRAGIANFSFDVPLASLSGRGIDASVGLTYNSRTWNKSLNSSGQEHYTYDVEQSWIAPGFSSGFGYLESAVQPLYYNGNIYGYKTYPTGLIEADGTRRQIYCSQPSGPACLAYETSDGLIIL